MRIPAAFTLLSLAGILSHARPSGPDLVPGVWTDISPKGLTFSKVTGDGTSFGQGLAMDPGNPDILYLGTANFDPVNDGVYKSLDAGSTWTRMGHLDEPLRVRVDPGNPLHLYAGDGVRGSSLGFWVSHDGGNSWAKPAGWTATATSRKYFIDDVYDVAVDPRDFRHILVSSHSPWNFGGDPVAGHSAGILESRDGGDSWTVHLPDTGWGYGHNIWFLKDASTWLLGTQGDGYWKTSDAGGNWKQVTKMNMAHGGGQIYYAKTGVLYSGGWDGIMRSTDDGETWSQVGPVRFCTAVYGDGNFLYAHQAYAGGDAPFFRSPESDGITWTAYAKGGIWGNGPFEMVFDARRGILYSSNWADGLLALKVEGANGIRGKSPGADRGARRNRMWTQLGNSLLPGEGAAAGPWDLYAGNGKRLGRVDEGGFTGKAMGQQRLLAVPLAGRDGREK